MDKQTLSNLIQQAKQGNRKAMEQLLILSHAPVYWQCRRLLNSQQLAEEMAEQILKGLTSQISRIDDADHFHKWLGTVTAERCMKKRDQIGISEYTPDSQDMSFPGKELNKSETAQVAQILADVLPEEHRICLILSACCRIDAKNIARLTGFSEKAVTEYITEAELGIREQMLVYQNQGVVFTGNLAVAALLRSAMYKKQNRSSAIAMMKKILPPIRAASAKSPKRSGNLIRILLCVIIALVLLLSLMIGGIVMKYSEQKAEDSTLPPTTIAYEVTETTQATVETSIEAAAETATWPATEETTVPETTEPVQTTEAAVMETTAPKVPYTPPVSSGVNSGNNAPKPTTDPNYNPGKGEDGHTHDFFTVPAAQKATCTRAAKIHRLCRLCNQGVTVDDPDNPALGHDYQVNIVVQPTASSKGYTNYKCTRCGDSYDSDYVDPLPAPETQAPVAETQPPIEASEAPVPDSDS